MSVIVKVTVTLPISSVSKYSDFFSMYQIPIEVSRFDKSKM